MELHGGLLSRATMPQVRAGRALPAQTQPFGSAPCTPTLRRADASVAAEKIVV
jgi:hypothetical protein